MKGTKHGIVSALACLIGEKLMTSAEAAVPQSLFAPPSLGVGVPLQGSARRLRDVEANAEDL